MKVKDAFLAACEVDIRKFPVDGLFEIVLIGKSNVGKSSFINAMTGRKSLARTSSAPGKTRTANFYRVNDVFYFVDMPGYGHAEVSKTQKAVYETIIIDYIRKRRCDFVVFFLLDSRHAPTKNDIAAYMLLKNEDITPVLILTKTDKQKTYVTNKNAEIIKRALDYCGEVIPFSVDSDVAKEKTWSMIDALLLECRNEYADHS